MTRAQSWSFFTPRSGGGDPTYTFLGNRATLGVRVTSVRFDVDGAFQYAQLLGLPRRSVGPGALGDGALYFDAARATRAYQLYFKRLSFRIKELAPGLAITIGRMPYTSGAEADREVERTAGGRVREVRRRRLDARLIGNDEWSIYERAYDGARVDVVRPAWQVTSALLFPTQGSYEESANPTISALRIATSALTIERPAGLAQSELQFFAYHYRDRRPVIGRPDNSGRTAPAADIDILTFGESFAGVFLDGAREIDAVAWLAGQRGDWYGQPHRALSVAAEGGYRWTEATWQPWLRAGVLYVSGDRSATDGLHQTFFQMIPTSRRYALSATYAQMNLHDVFAQAIVTPHPRLSVRADVHRLTLDHAADRWYYGSGATARRGGFFGYAVRTSAGATGLGTVVEGTADVTLNRHWSINAYVGTIAGGEIVRRTFAGRRLTLFAIENMLSF